MRDLGYAVLLLIALVEMKCMGAQIDYGCLT
jgi:hypothetical protein